jgi:superfamily II DNA or RNA helicase
MRIGEDPSKGYLSDNLWVPKAAVNVEGVKSALTFPYFEGKDRTQRELPLYLEAEHHLIVPRKFWKEGQFTFEVFDCRPQKYKKTNIRSRIKLDHKELNDGSLIPTGEHVQQQALEALLSCLSGILELGCGKGKTIIALEAITCLQVPVLIVVDNMQLQSQWLRAIEKFLEVPGGIGLVGDGEFDWEGRSIVLATYQTLAQKARDLPESFRRWFGAAFYDEAHHVNAPTFSRSADLIYGRRYGLTATPKRDDGLHVIHEFHFGSSFYRDLKQELRPRIYFEWTGFTLDMNDPHTVASTHTDAGELHLSKLAVWFGQWRERMEHILHRIQQARDEGRKILVLSNSVDELVNMLAIWNGMQELYTGIETPPLLPGEPEPCLLEKKERKDIERDLEHCRQVLASGPSKATQLETMRKIEAFELALASHEVARRINKIVRKEEAKFRDKLLAIPSDAGLMIHKVPTAERTRMLQEKAVTFAINKYGREGLDEPSIDTVVLCEPTSSRNAIQQIMGRELRHKQGKSTPVFIIFEDNIKPLILMCRKMRSHFRKWPIEDGGPYSYEFCNYPESARKLR